MKATELTNHGAALVGVPLNRRWNDAPVKLRCDIEAHAKRVSLYGNANGLDLLAYAMETLSLSRAVFGAFDRDMDALVKRQVAGHHQTWIMKPLERLYDEMKKAAEPAEAGTAYPGGRWV